ncbi:hypothetical protein ACFQ0Q_50415 [Streptomyces aureus]
MKTAKRVNKSGTVRYLHLAHNEWDPMKGRAVSRRCCSRSAVRTTWTARP